MPFSICFLLFLYYSLFSHLFVLIGNPIWQGIRAVSTPQKILWHGHFPARGSAQGGPLPLQWQFHGLWCISSRFSRQRKGYQPCSLQCTGRGYWCGTGNHSGLPQSAAPQPPQRLPPAQGRAQRWQYQQTILSDPGASVAPS